MVVRIHRGQLNYFRTKARNNHNEIEAMLIGKVVTPQLIEINRIDYPLLSLSLPGEVCIDRDAFLRVYDKAKSDGLEFIGTVHSHPNWPAILSGRDYRSFKDGAKILGVVGIINRKTHVFVWERGSSLPCTIEYFD